MLSGSRLQAELGARGELRRWATARQYWDRAVEYLELARAAADPDIQSRYLKIARHYRAAAEAEERAAFARTDERLAGRSERRAC
jgi:hypothetical protein